MDFKIPVSEGQRRLPVYLLVDISGSMTGTGIAGVNQGLQQFKREAMDVQEAVETMYVGIITFETNAQFETNGLVSIVDFIPPTLSTGGTTNLGEAFDILNNSLDNDIKANIPGGKEKGDYKPLIFVLTDGVPDSGWEYSKNKIMNRVKNKLVNIITVGCGTGIDEQCLKDISTGISFKMSNTDADFKQFFKWVTQSAVAASVGVSIQNVGAQNAKVNMPPPPSNMAPIVFDF